VEQRYSLHSYRANYLALLTRLSSPGST
jgi:hypothetical protein